MPWGGFAATSLEAELRFELTAARTGAVVERFPHPLPGPSGEAIATAVTSIGPSDATDALVVISGIHGVEHSERDGDGSGGVQS